MNKTEVIADLDSKIKCCEGLLNQWQKNTAKSLMKQNVDPDRFYINLKNALAYYEQMQDLISRYIDIKNWVELVQE